MFVLEIKVNLIFSKTEPLKTDEWFSSSTDTHITHQKIWLFVFAPRPDNQHIEVPLSVFVSRGLHQWTAVIWELRQGLSLGLAAMGWSNMHWPEIECVTLSEKCVCLTRMSLHGTVQ